MRESLAIIPARGGSKRIVGKNIRHFGGKPMIAWSIEAALQSDEFDRVVVSTDDVEIQRIALVYGAECSFLRPDDLSDDHAGLMVVMRHAIEQLENEASTLTMVACIYATAPFIRVDDIRAAAQLWRKDDAADFVLGVCEFESPVQRAFKKSTSNFLQFQSPENSLARTQDLETSYYDAGQFFMGSAAAFANCASTMEGNTLGFPIPASRCVDIDTPEDWNRALDLWNYIQFTGAQAA